jgi:Uma2 family endonuclease
MGSTVADLIYRLGGVPPERILLDPLPGTATEDDVIRLLERSDRYVELIDGVLVEKPMGAEEGLLAGWIVRTLWNFVLENDLGLVLGDGAPTRFRLGLVRLPDVSFVRWNRIPNERFPKDKVSKLIPNLAIEVLSESNTKREMELKLDEYFTAGVQVAWIIDPKTQSAKVYTSRTRHQIIGPTGVLVAGKILPGFRLSMNELFEVGNRQPKRKKRK